MPSNTPKLSVALLGLAALGLIGAPASHAIAPPVTSLISTSVTGSLTFTGNPNNYFDPANGFVPATGFANSSPHTGTTVTIADPAVEFGFDDGLNRDTADFTSTQLTITDVSVGTSLPATYTFTDPSFAGLSNVSNTFTGGVTASLVGNTITVNTPAIATPGTYRAVFNINPAATAAPEPSSVAAFAFTGLGALGLVWKARKRRTAA